MKVRSGGYQTGRTYRWYRDMGHWPHSAFSMRWSTAINGITIATMAAVAGWLLGEILFR